MTGDAATSRPSVTAVVCTRNRPTFLPAALQSLAAAVGPGDEVVVVESGDSDAANAIAALGEAAAQFRHLRSPVAAKSHKQNMAIQAAANDLLVLTDDDARVDPGWIDAMAAAFCDDDVGMAFGPVLGLSHHGTPAITPPAGEAPGETWLYAHGAAMAIRRRAAEDAGGFDERLGPGAPAHGEEHDLLLRVRERGWRIVIAAAPAVTHLDWRDDSATRANLLVYERGSGAFLAAAVRRHPVASSRLLGQRLRYQLALLRRAPIGRAAARAFAGGLLYGLRLSERRWLPVDGDPGS